MLSEYLIELHIASIGNYDILYPILIFISLIVYFITSYIELFILNSKLSFKVKKAGFEGKKYVLGISIAVILYFREIRETNIIVPVVTVLTFYNFTLRINNYFPGNNFLSKIKTGIIIFFRELRKSIELPAIALSVILIVVSLNCNRMLTLMPIQMLFWFNFINRMIQLGGMIFKKET